MHGSISKRLYTIDETAKWLSMTPKRLRLACLLKKVRAVKIGRQWRISAAEIDRIEKEGIRNG